MNAITKSLNTSQIIKLIDESIDINQCHNLKNHIKLKSWVKTDDSMQSNDQSSQDYNTGLSRRIKREHLTCDQILYLKDFIVASNLTTRELWSKF